jgi:carboxypeptidase C (cathepsin A)
MQNEALIRIMNGDLANASGYTNFIIANDTIADKYYNGMNVLNYKLYDNSDINENYAKYVEANKGQFGVPANKSYVDDYEEMYYAFNADLSRSFKPQLERVLNMGIKTLIYNGQNDFIVNTAGVLTYMNTLKWQHAKEWRAAKKTMWKDYDDITNLGWTKNYANLYFTLIRNAGHLVPSD